MATDGGPDGKQRRQVWGGAGPGTVEEDTRRSVFSRVEGWQGFTCCPVHTGVGITECQVLECFLLGGQVPPRKHWAGASALDLEKSGKQSPIIYLRQGSLNSLEGLKSSVPGGKEDLGQKLLHKSSEWRKQAPWEGHGLAGSEQ